jgi:protoporphyrinogen oxidase
LLGLLGNNKTRNRRNTKILYEGHYVKYPFENGLADLPKEENFECLYYFIQNLINKEKGKLKKPRNLKEWCYYTFGKGIAEKYLIPYNEKIWKYPSAKTSLDWVERIPDPPIEDIIRSSLGIETEGYAHQLFFYYPKIGGIQSLVNRLKERIADRITKKFKIKEIRREDNGWIVSDGREEKTCEKIVSTIPVQELIEAISAPKEVKKATRNLKYNSLISVMLGLNTPKAASLSWLYVPNKSILPHRVSFPSNYGPCVAPSGKSSVVAETTCTVKSEIWRMTDEAVIDRVADDLHNLRILDKKDICFARARRTEYAYIISDLDHHKNVRIVRDYVTRMGIDLVGRFAESEYMNMDACVRRAMDYVRKKEQQRSI